ncbi:MAG: hypothetical protein OEV89_13130 [Desulfobulbaceae bacterium]|nr:hypothetical protein [Desulfobulbaceae bacterium]HIJ91603.1 hypothetical protein [Deltaproteobacteria bacterium]
MALAHGVHFKPAEGRQNTPAVVASGQPLLSRFLLAFHNNGIVIRYLLNAGKRTKHAAKDAKSDNLTFDKRTLRLSFIF